MTASEQGTRSAPVGTETDPPTRVLRQLLVVVGLGLLLGGATSLAQGLLPIALRPFANSASGWTLLTAGAVAASRARTRPSALFGAASFVALVLGYQLMSTLRGFPTSETLFLVIGVIVGPFVGVAASWLRRAGARAAIGCGVLSGIALGEGAYGLIEVCATTGWVYWTLISVAGLALLFVTLLRGPRAPRASLLTVGLTALVAVSFFFSYAAIGELAL